jgi:hypothetical protein
MLKRGNKQKVMHNFCEKLTMRRQKRRGKRERWAKKLMKNGVENHCVVIFFED